ncbi:MAG: glycoside hydrolase family 3 N-terminal domain-containing protein [Acidimicrobiales bacterium]
MSALLTQLSIDEKVSLVSGADVWRTTAIPRLGLGAVKVTDGPNGARGDSESGARAVCLPASIALGASFDPALVTEVGRLLGRETARKGSHVLLAPTINIARHPLGGRNFESMGEDPTLTSTLAVAYIQGVQDEGVGACAKHLVANDVEWHRLTVSSEVTEAVLREVYLVPFEAAADAEVWTMMAAYPKLNGVHCTEHAWLLTDVVRHEWGYDGLIMSDWGATLSAAAPIGAGLDLEMPGPAHALGANLKAALDAGEVSESDLDQRVLRVLQLAQRAGRLATTDEAPEQSVDLPEERALARRAATSGMVLLRNKPLADRPATLPFAAGALRSVAVVGPNSHPGVIQGGGSAQLPAHYIVSPVDGLAAALPGAEVTHHDGVLAHRYLPLIGSDQWVVTDGNPVTIELFDNYTLEAEPVSIRHGRNIHVFLQGVVDGPTDNMVWSQRITGTIKVDTTGSTSSA